MAKWWLVTKDNRNVIKKERFDSQVDVYTAQCCATSSENFVEVLVFHGECTAHFKKEWGAVYNE